MYVCVCVFACRCASVYLWFVCMSGVSGFGGRLQCRLCPLLAEWLRTASVLVLPLGVGYWG
jgi:hypothetical protein